MRAPDPKKPRMSAMLGKGAVGGGVLSGARSGVGGGVLSRAARGGHAVSPMRPLKPTGPPQIKLSAGPALSRAEKEKLRKQAMD